MVDRVCDYKHFTPNDGKRVGCTQVIVKEVNSKISFFFKWDMKIITFYQNQISLIN